MKAEDWIKQLQLEAHPEGGYYKETYRCKEILTAANLPERFDQPHSFSTAIYYLLNAPNFSAFHKIKQDELWHFYQGSTLTIHVITAAGEYQRLPLGSNVSAGQSFQHIVQGGDCFAASVDEGYALVGCTVAPGFEFADFDLAERERLVKRYPQHQHIINQFTR